MSLNHPEIFPSHRAAAIQTALTTTFATTPTEITLLAGGLSAATVYKMIVADRPYVLKLEAPDARTMTTTAAEKAKLAADAGVAPGVYYRNAEEGIVISEFIENKPVRSVFSGELLAVKLAAAIKATHAISYTTPGNDMKAFIDQLLQDFRQRNILSGAIPDECLSRYEQVRAIYPWDDTDKVFSHNDLNPSNILCDGENIRIIDWDTAFLNDRYVDLAGIANFFVHTPEQEKTFLHEYFEGGANEYQFARFKVMRQISRIIYSLLMLQLASQGKPANYSHDQQMEGVTLKEVGPLIGAGKLSLATYEGQFMYGKALMNEALQQMRAAEFAQYTALLSNR